MELFQLNEGIDSRLSGAARDTIEREPYDGEKERKKKEKKEKREKREGKNETRVSCTRCMNI